MTQDNKEITQLFPQGKEVTLKGTPFTIKPIGFGKLPAVLKLLKEAKDVQVENDQLKMGALGSFMMANGELVVDLCALATNQKKEFFDDVPLDEALDLLQAVFEVNADFFIKRLQPKLLTALSKLSESAGGLSSQGLLQTATA
jgi:hypothetical protein